MRVVTVSRLHHLMRSYQIHTIGRQPVMLDERMLLNDSSISPLLFGFGGCCISCRSLMLPSTKMVRAAVPITQSRLDRDAIKPAAVGEACRKKRDTSQSVFSDNPSLPSCSRTDSGCAWPSDKPPVSSS